jgi:Proteins of 100 residues with WXG
MFPSNGGSTAGGIPSIPGDPGSLFGAASRLGATASAVSDWGSQLCSITSGLAGTNWSGQGAVSFASCSSALQANHRSAAGALTEAATALSTFASVLADCQASVTAAQAQVTDAQMAASSAMTQLNAQPISPHDPAAATARTYSEAAVQSSLEQSISAAMSSAEVAWSRYEAAAARAAAQIGSAIPSWSAMAEKIGWLNDKAGFGLVPAGLGFLVPLARAGVRYLQTDNAIAEAMPGWEQENLGSFEEMFETGQMSDVEFAAKVQAYADSLQIVKVLFNQAAVHDVGAGGITPEMRFSSPLTATSRFMAGAAVVSDIATVVRPDDDGAAGWVDRSMAGVNGVASLDAAAGGAGTEALGGVLGIVDVSSSWIPVAGQVVLAGTALYLAGDWAYNNVKFFHDGINDVGHGLADAGEGIAHGVSDVAHFFGL